MEPPRIKSKDCKTPGCKSTSEVYCNCNESDFCINCLITHLQQNSSTCHMVQTFGLPKLIYENSISPIEILCHKLELSSEDTWIIRNSKITMRQLLKFTMAQVYSFADQLSLSENTKYRLYDELYYIKLATGKIHIKDCLQGPNSFLHYKSETDPIPSEMPQNVKKEVIKEENPVIKTENDVAFEDLFNEANI
ncbi:unnamed protein product [Blepharisma stoltei]|uniref:Uncharacterized protein n=1 Tax=Blepharisma stoltei TaxID=1481888 RepID=A0AAU9JVY3_9CILI|nr:unnamed protein product [Blepharisma stoltei]